MKLTVFALLFTSTFAATIVDPSSCSAYPCLIFEDEFDFLDLEAWETEINMAGGGNWEFQQYINNRSTAYCHDSTLFIKPGLASDIYGDTTILDGHLNLEGQNDRGEDCTAHLNYGCDKTGFYSSGGEIINPVVSARLRTLQNFYFTYGTVELRAKMPRGDWLWPAIWLLPHHFSYGFWPASGEIDILESRGNDVYLDSGNDRAASTLHWGPYASLNRYYLTTSEYQTSDLTSFADAFHTWKLEWSDTNILIYLDDVLQLTVDPVTNFFDFGGYDANTTHNPWQYATKMAPFDRNFYIIMNVAVGGTNGYFPDDASKPWSNGSPHAMRDFYEARDTWYPTWTQGESSVSEGAALQVDYIRVYANSA